MKLKYPTLFFVSLALTVSLCAQAGCIDVKQTPDSAWTKVRFDQKFRHADWDGDGKPEKISIQMSRGSSYSGERLRTRLSKSGKTLEVWFGGSFTHFFSLTGIPEILEQPGKRKLFAKVEATFVKRLCENLDPSAQFLLSRKPVWIDGEPKMPGNYTVVVQKKDYPKLFAEFDVKTEHAWLFYKGFNHRRMRNTQIGPNRFKQFAENKRYKILGTAHGAVLVDKVKHRYAWVYVYKGGTKLRWPSVLGAYFDKAGKVKIRFNQKLNYLR